MRRTIVAAGLFWLGVLALLGTALSGIASLQADEGLADIGYAILAVMTLGLAGGLHGAFLLVTPPRSPRWKLTIATVLAAAPLVLLAFALARDAPLPTGRLLVVGALVTLPALAGLVRAPRLWRRPA